MHVKC